MPNMLYRQLPNTNAEKILWNKERLVCFDFQSLIDSWSEKITEIPLEELGDRLGKLSYESLAKIIETKELFSSSSLSQI